MLGNLGPYGVDIIDTILEKKRVFFLGTPKALKICWRYDKGQVGGHESARYNSPIGMSRLADELIGMEYRRKLLQRREELSQSGDVLRIDAGIGEKNGKKGGQTWSYAGKAWVLLG